MKSVRQVSFEPGVKEYKRVMDNDDEDEEMTSENKASAKVTESRWRWQKDYMGSVF